MENPTWEIVNRNYGYRPGSGSLKIVKKSENEFAIGYDADRLAEEEKPNYYVHYCSSMQDCLEYAKKEGYK